MKNEEQERIHEIEFSFSTIIRAIRKEARISQKDAASLLGLTQSTFSKVERGVVSTGVENWLQFASILAINFDAPLLGIVDFGKQCNYRHTLKPASPWKIPQKYVTRPTISSRLISILCCHLKEQGYGKKIKDFHESKFVDGDFFIISHNCVSLIYLSELLDYLGLKFTELNIEQMKNSLSFKRHLRDLARSSNESSITQETISQKALYFEDLLAYCLAPKDQKLELIIKRRDDKTQQDYPREVELIARVMQQIFSELVKSKNPTLNLSLIFES